MNMQVQGKIHAAFDAEQVTQRFRKREFVLELEGESRYPQYVMFQFTGDRCEMLDGYAEGDEVKVEFSLRGREWTIRRATCATTSRPGRSIESVTLRRWAPQRMPAVLDEPPPPADDDDIPF